MFWFRSEAANEALREVGCGSRMSGVCREGFENRRGELLTTDRVNSMVMGL